MSRRRLSCGRTRSHVRRARQCSAISLLRVPPRARQHKVAAMRCLEDSLLAARLAMRAVWTPIAKATAIHGVCMALDLRADHAAHVGRSRYGTCVIAPQEWLGGRSIESCAGYSAATLDLLKDRMALAADTASQSEPLQAIDRPS